MPPSKDNNSKPNYTRSYSNNGMSLGAKVYHPATNLQPASPPQSPTGMAPAFGSKTSSSSDGMSLGAKVYHPATNLQPASPPQSPTGMAPAFGSKTSSSSGWGRQSSQNGKYS